jgi:hypothetical protein
MSVWSSVRSQLAAFTCLPMQILMYGGNCWETRWTRLLADSGGPSRSGPPPLRTPSVADRVVGPLPVVSEHQCGLSRRSAITDATHWLRGAAFTSGIHSSVGLVRRRRSTANETSPPRGDEAGRRIHLFAVRRCSLVLRFGGELGQNTAQRVEVGAGESVRE